MGRKAAVLLVALAGAMFLIIGIGTLSAQQGVEVTLDKASPASYAGVCPKQVSFKATVTAKSAGKVTYEWVIMDGDQASTKPGGTLDFAAAGKQEVTGKIEFGEEGESKHGGTVMMRITAPAKLDSNKSEFKVTCKEEILT